MKFNVREEWGILSEHLIFKSIKQNFAGIYDQEKKMPFQKRKLSAHCHVLQISPKQKLMQKMVYHDIPRETKKSIFQSIEVT